MTNTHLIQHQAHRLGLQAAHAFLSLVSTQHRTTVYSGSNNAAPSSEEVVSTSLALVKKHDVKDAAGHHSLMTWGRSLAVAYRPTQPAQNASEFRLAVDERVATAPKWRVRQQQLRTWAAEVRVGPDAVAVAVLLELTQAVDLRSKLEATGVADAVFDVLAASFFTEFGRVVPSTEQVAVWCELISELRMPLSPRRLPPALQVFAEDAVYFYSNVEQKVPTFDHKDYARSALYQWSRDVADFCLAPAFGGLGTSWTTALRKATGPKPTDRQSSAPLTADLAVVREELRRSWTVGRAASN